MDPIMTVVIVVVVILVIIALWYIGTSNSLNVAVVKIEEAFSGIDVALNKRYDVLMKMADAVRSYTKHEVSTLTQVINARQGMSMEEKKTVSRQMDEALSQMNVMVENYPDLKASQTYTVLQKSILEVEEHLQASRRVYNANVSRLNQMIVTFPTSIVASSKKLTQKEFFEIEDHKRNDVDLNI